MTNSNLTPPAALPGQSPKFSSQLDRIEGLLKVLNASASLCQSQSLTTKAQRYDSRFDLVQRTPQGNRTVCADLTYSQAAALVTEMPTFIVKFACMEVVA